MRAPPRKYFAFFVPAAAVLAADLVTKTWAVKTLTRGPVEVVRGFFSLALAFNEGGAWGFLARWDSPARNLFFICASVLACAVILYMLLHSPDESVFEPVALGPIQHRHHILYCQRVKYPREVQLKVLEVGDCWNREEQLEGCSLILFQEEPDGLNGYHSRAIQGVSDCRCSVRQDKARELG